MDQMDMFSVSTQPLAPLADRMRPRTLDDFIGQTHIVGKGKLLRRAIEADRLTSSIFWGPPGCGKTTLASIIAESTRAAFVKLNSVSGDSENESVSQFFHILGAVEQQRGCARMPDGSYEITVYTSCINLDKGIYYYTTYENRGISAVDLHRCDLDGAGLYLYPLEKTLQQKNIYCLHNWNDFLLSPADRIWLDKTLKERMVWFDAGGHLGNLYMKVFRDKLMDVSGKK